MEEDKTSFVEAAMGGEGHSPEPPAEASAGMVPPEEDSGIEETRQENGKTEEKSDGGEVESLRQEIEKLNKRLHDTQAAYHEKSELLAQRERLLAERERYDRRETDDDDWFSDDDKRQQADIDSQLKELDGRLKESDARVMESSQEDANAAWDRESERVRREHADFDKVVYDFIGEKCFPEDESKVDPNVRRLYDGLKDKSPQSVYDLGRRLMEQDEMLSDPKAYRQRVRDEVMRELGQSDAPTGRAGLNAVNSAVDDPVLPSDGGGGFVETLFK